MMRLLRLIPMRFVLQKQLYQYYYYYHIVMPAKTSTIIMITILFPYYLLKQLWFFVLEFSICYAYLVL